MKTFKFATFNANSVRARLPAVTNWLAKEEPDILCLQETKVQDKDFPHQAFEAQGYHIAFRGQKSYNGVSILSRHALTEIGKDLYEGGDEQARFISAVIQGLPVINVYVPQGYAVGTEKFEYKLHWLRDLLAHVKASYDPSRPLLIAGDFNIALDPADVHDPEKFKGEVCFHPDEQAILRAFLDWGLVDIFRKHVPGGDQYTFWDYRIPNALKRKMGWRIENILATAPLAERSRTAWVDTEARLAPKPSDHTYLVAEFEKDPDS